jgi:hypothetical protein
MNFIIKSKNINKVICLLLALIFPLKSFAAEEIERFDPIGGVSIKLDGSIYTGVLFSEEERLRYLNLEIDYNELTEKYKNLEIVYEQTRSAYQSIYEKTLDIHIEQLRFLDQLQKDIDEEPKSFWEENKGSIFFTIGVVLTSVVFISYEAAK